MRYIDLFEKKIDKMFADGELTKAQLFDAFHKCNPLSLHEVKNEGIVNEANPKCDYCQSDNVEIVEIHCKDCNGYTVL